MDDATATRVAPLVARLLDEADHYYESAQYGLPRLAWRSAWAVATARHVDRDIGVEVRRRSSHAWRERVVVTTTPATIARVLQGGLEATWTRGPAPTAAGPSRRGLYTPATLAMGRMIAMSWWAFGWFLPAVVAMRGRGLSDSPLPDARAVVVPACLASRAP